MKLAVLCFLLYVLQAQACGSNFSPPVVTFVWKTNSSGIWEDPNNWVPYGYPRSGSHLAVINVTGTYTITHTKFLLAGALTVTVPGARVQLIQSLGWLIDPNTIPEPTVLITGQFVSSTVNVNITNFLIPLDQSIWFIITNVNSGYMYNFTATPTLSPGVWSASVQLSCQNVTNANLTNGAPGPIGMPIVNSTVDAQAFDSILATYTLINRTYDDMTTLVFTDHYQVRWGWKTIGKVMFIRALQKNLASLLRLKAKLLWIEANLPPYEDNHCCSDESYIYPIPLSALEKIAVASYYFYTGTPTQYFNDTIPIKQCYQPLPDFCTRLNIQLAQVEEVPYVPPTPTIPPTYAIPPTGTPEVDPPTGTPPIFTPFK